MKLKKRINQRKKKKKTNSNQENKDQIRYNKQIIWHLHTLARRRERKVEGKEKSSWKPNNHVVAHTRCTIKKRMLTCFNVIPEDSVWPLKAFAPVAWKACTTSTH